MQRKSDWPSIPQDVGCLSSEPVFSPPCFLFPENNSFVLKLNRNGLKLHQKGEDLTLKNLTAENVEVLSQMKKYLCIISHMR